MNVRRDREGKGNFENFTVEVQPEDIPEEDSAEMEEFVRNYGKVVGLKEDDLPIFRQEVRTRYAHRRRRI